MRRGLLRVRPGPPRRPSLRTAGGWLALAAVLTLLGGRAGLVLAALIVLWDLLLAPAPRAFLLAALLGFLAVPVTILLRGLPTGATLSPDFAAGSLLPHLLAGTSLALLVLGVLRDVRAGLARGAARPELGVPAAGTDRALLPPRPGERPPDSQEPP
jgi:hypothetical protein